MDMFWDQYFSFEGGALVFLIMTFALASLALNLARTFIKKI